MTDWGVPDWKDGPVYPKPDDLIGFEWWWEFTRRRPDYRKLWQSAEPVEGKSYRYAPDVDAFRLRFQLSVIHDPAGSLIHWQLRQLRYPRGGLYSARDAFLNSIGHRPDEPEIMEADKRSKLQEQQGIFYHSFDLSVPLGPQFDRAMLILENVQAELYPHVTDRRRRREHWPTFLRVLDARDAGATLQQIADEVHPHPEEGAGPGWARDKLTAARHLRDNFPV